MTVRGFNPAMCHASWAGSSRSQIARSARLPGSRLPRSESPSARAACNVAPASAYSGVKRNSVHAMFSIVRIEVQGEVPGLQSVATAIGTPCRRSRSTGGALVSRSV